MSITGNLRTLEFAELLQWLAQGQKTGALIIKNDRTEKRIYFKKGKIVSSESDNPAEHLGQYMVREGLLDEETLSRAMKLQESTQILLGKVLVTLGSISEEELLRILRRKTEESLYELFNWTAGDFRFVPDQLPKLPMVPLEIDVTNVVLEGAKRLDEARRDARDGTRDFGAEIENLLSSDVFNGIEVTDSGAVETVAEPDEDAEVLPVPLSVPAAVPSFEDSSTNVRGYYSGAHKKAKARTPLLLAAAGLTAVGIGVGAYFFMRPDPAAGIAERTSLDRPAVFAVAELPPNVADSLEPATGEAEAPAELGPTSSSEVTAGPSVTEREQMKARYEAELEALKQQLEKAQLAAAERDEALGRVADLEEQVAQVQEAALLEEPAARPEARFKVASLQSPLEVSSFTAGGDEPPPFAGPQPTTEADQEAGSGFATGMVESAAPVKTPATPSSRPEKKITPPPAQASEPPRKEPERQAALAVSPAQITPPVLVSRPKPRYPAAAMRLGKEAIVTLRLLVDANGKVVDVERVGEEQGLGFDKSAINAALNSEWQPGTRDGEPVEMWAEMRISFKP